MKFKLVFLISLVLLFQIVTAQDKGVKNQSVDKLPSENKRWALIIGVDNYRDDISPLYGSVNDARALKDVLVKNAGFPEKQVILMTTDSADSDLIPNRGNVLDQLDKLSRQIPDEGLLLFSFSGHGVSIGKDAFLIPSDGRIYENPELLRERSIDVLRIRKAIEATKATQVLMLLDACRNDPLKGKGDEPNRLTEAYNNGFSFDTKNKGINAFATIYATQFQDRAFEFFDKETQKYRGFFSYAIEEGLRGKAANQKGEITLGGLIDYIGKTVKDRVYVEKNQRQVPYPMTEGFNNSNLVLAIGGSNIKTSAEIAWENFAPEAQKFLKYDYIEKFSEGLAKVTLRNKYGFIDNTGKEVIPPKYDFGIKSFSEGLSVVYLNKKAGFIDITGKEVIPLKYEEIQSFSEGFALAKLNGKWGFIDKSNKQVVAFKYEDAEPFVEGFAAVKTEGGWGFIDRTGREVITPQYFKALSFSDGLALVMGSKSFSKESWGFIDKTGREITSFKYDVADSFWEGLAWVKLNDKYGFIDKTGKEVIPIKYDKVWSFSNGLAKAELNNKYGFIDKTGKEVITFKYVHTAPNWFSEGFVATKLKLNGNYGFIDTKGSEVTPPKYDDVYAVSEGIARVKLNSQYGYIDKTGREVVPIKYDDIWCEAFIKKGFIGVTSKGKKGFVDLQGNEYFFDN